MPHVSRQPRANPTKGQTTADILVETLIAWGAPFVFGVVGDGINPIVEALRKREGQIRYVGTRHEEAAALMASGIAKHTSKLGVCIGTTVAKPSSPRQSAAAPSRGRSPRRDPRIPRQRTDDGTRAPTGAR